MSILRTIKGWLSAIFKSKANEIYKAASIASETMDGFVKRCVAIYLGKPEWIDAEQEIKTINFAQTLCKETARLTTLAISITIAGSARADYIQKQIDKIYFSLRSWVEYGLAYGMIALKPDGDQIELFTHERFYITEADGDNARGALFFYSKTVGNDYYTRMEYHRFVGEDYLIDNKCFKGKAMNDTTTPVSIENTPWAGLLESAKITGLEKPLFAIFKTPGANRIDINSPVGMPLINEVLEELKDLDVAYSRKTEEVYDSRKTVLMDSKKMLPPTQELRAILNSDRAAVYEAMKKRMKLPKYVRIVDGDNKDGFYQEINPQIRAEERQKDINAILSQIGFKVGYSNGYFVFDAKTGMITATQVESDDRRTIQLIKDIRDQLEKCIDGLVYAINGLCDLYEIAPGGKYEITYGFGDITYNVDEDRARWWSYVTAGKVPAWVFFVKFEGMSEEEAKAMVEEADVKEPALFDE